MKRRPKGTGRVYKRGGIYWIQYTLHGKRQYESTGSQFREQAETLLRKRLSNPLDTKPTVNELLDKLIVDLEARGKNAYRTVSHLRPVREKLGDMKVKDVDEDTILHYQELRMGEVSPSTINRECQLLGQAINKIGYPKMAERPLLIRRLVEPPARQDFFEPGEIHQIIQHLPEYLRDYALFGSICGWRKGEISGLLWDDVHMASGEIRLAKTKNGLPRLLVITEEIAEILSRQSAKRLPGCAYVFHHNGHYIGDIWWLWKKAREQAGLPGKVFHAMRRSTVRDLVRAGVHEKVAMSITGHKSRAIFDRYNITNAEDIKQGLEAMTKYRKDKGQISDSEGNEPSC